MAINKITQFFYNLVTYGGICTEKGILYVWGDPTTFFSLEGFAYLQHFLVEKFGEQGSNLLYWLGKVNGKTATEVLMKRYGFNAKDIHKFVNGATQDGFGHYRITDIKYNPVRAVLNGSNSVFAETYKKMYGQQKNPVDDYMRGVIAGGSEPLFKTFMKGEEIKCVAKGDSECIVHDFAIKKEEGFPLVKKSKINVNKLLKKSTDRYFKVAGKFKVIAKRNIRIGDGAFLCNGIPGVIIAQRMVIILSILLEKLLNKSDFNKLMEGIAEKNIDAIYSPKIKFSMYPRVLNIMLARLSIFGLGEFKISSIIGNKLKIMNETKYSMDYRTIVGSNKNPNCPLCAVMLKKLFEKYHKKAVVKPMGCIGPTGSNCFYEVKLGK